MVIGVIEIVGVSGVMPPPEPIGSGVKVAVKLAGVAAVARSPSFSTVTEVSVRVTEPV